MKYFTSPDRGSFMMNHYKKSLDKGDITQDYFDSIQRMLSQKESPKDADLGWDLRGSEWIANKCKYSPVYSQNLYAALCNNRFLQDKKEWTCSWRYAGGIIADLNEKGDYIDWYCSGIGHNTDGFVGEGFITDEVRLDLLKLGWTVEPYNFDDMEIFDENI
jgi:hypothetical protein